MASTLELYVSDGSIATPYLSRAFKDELIFEWYISFKVFLTAYEIKMISPNPLGKITLGEKKKPNMFQMSEIIKKASDMISGKGIQNNPDALFDEFLITSEKLEDRERDPKVLNSIFQKIEAYLMEQAAHLPLVHTLHKNKSLDDEVNRLIIDDVEAHVEGDLFYYEDYPKVRNKIHLKSYYDDFGKVNLYVDATPEVHIAGQKYYSKTITKAQQFAGEFKLCYDFLNQAIKQNKKVLWEIF